MESIMLNKFKPAQGKLLISIDLDTKTKGGIYLLEQSSTDKYYATIVKVGNSLSGISDTYLPGKSIIISKATKERSTEIELDDVVYNLIDNMSVLMYEE